MCEAACLCRHPAIPRKKLIELFEYVDGRLQWRITQGKHKAGDLVGCEEKNGYRRVHFHGKSYRVHALVMMFHGKRIPRHFVVDHINRDPRDNRLENLRAVPRLVNQQNALRSASRNKHGVVGVQCHGGGYHAGIVVAGKYKHLGSHKTPEAASAAYLAAKEKYHAFKM